ncbi:MAG: hypothetical protein V4576_03065 [Patescibacteria group bacterium]
MEITPILKHSDSYDSLNFVHTQCACVYKKVGYTPLQVVKSFSAFLLPEELARCTYVGRLDPMAEGWMHVLWSGNMEEKGKIAASNKIYEIEVLFGLSTDTGDVLGLIKDTISPENITEEQMKEVVQTFVGSFTYPYPKYSSPNIKKTLQENQNDTIKFQKGHISQIDFISYVHVLKKDLEKEIRDKLSACRMDGDFRLETIQEAWKYFFEHDTRETFLKIKLQIHCSSGTYMRTLAEELGKKTSSSSIASSIKRIGITYCVE